MFYWTQMFLFVFWGITNSLSFEVIVLLLTIELTFRKENDNTDGSTENSRNVTFHAWVFHLDCKLVSQNLHGKGNQLKPEPTTICLSTILN